MWAACILPKSVRTALHGPLRVRPVKARLFAEFKEGPVKRTGHIPQQASTVKLEDQATHLPASEGNVGIEIDGDSDGGRAPFGKAEGGEVHVDRA